MRGKRLRVEALLAAATYPTPPPLETLIPPEQHSQVPPDLLALLAMLPRADLYVQDEMQVAHHATLTRVWSRCGRDGQRRVSAPGTNQKAYAFGLADWRDGWCHGELASRRAAAPFCAQMERIVARSRARGRVAMVILDNLNTHTPRGSLLVRDLLSRHGQDLYLIYTPKYDPEANPIERLWRVTRREVTHNHQREAMEALLDDMRQHFAYLSAHPEDVLRHIGSPGIRDPALAGAAATTHLHAVSI